MPIWLEKKRDIIGLSDGSFYIVYGSRAKIDVKNLLYSLLLRNRPRLFVCNKLYFVKYQAVKHDVMMVFLHFVSYLSVQFALSLTI